MSPLGVVAKVLGCTLEVSEFDLFSYYYVHFQTYIFGKDMNFLIPTNYGLDSTTTVLQQGELWR